MATQKKSTGARAGKKSASTKSTGTKTASKGAATKSASSTAAGKSGGKTSRQNSGKTSSARSSSKSAGTRGLRESAEKVVAGGDRVREGVRDIAVAAMDGAAASAETTREVVHEIMSGASSAVSEAMPKSSSSPLREVVAGLTEAASVIAAGGRRAADKASKAARSAAKEGAAMRDTALRSTHDMLAAVEHFATSVSGATRKELDHLVAEARTTGGRLEAPTRRAAEAVAKHPTAFAKESAETGMRMALGTTSRLMTAAGGMLSGLGDSLGRASQRGGGGSGGDGSRSKGGSGRKSAQPSVGAKRSGGPAAKSRPTAPRSRKT